MTFHRSLISVVGSLVSVSGNSGKINHIEWVSSTISNNTPTIAITIDGTTTNLKLSATNYVAGIEHLNDSNTAGSDSSLYIPLNIYFESSMSITVDTAGDAGFIVHYNLD